MTGPDYEKLTEALPGAVFLGGEPLSRHTTFRIGGPADLFAVPSDEEELVRICREASRLGIPTMVIGKGSNLLVSDRGIRALVIQTGRLDRICREGACIEAGAGIPLARLASYACEQGLSGMEFAHGIPGSLGGAVYMNAGAYGGEMAGIVESVRFLRDGRILEAAKEDMDFSYRYSALKKTGGIVLSVRVRLSEGDPDTIRETMSGLDARRKEKQPLEYPSAGSFFKRPAGYYAGALIEGAGLKGASVGGAKISEKHAGFVINQGNATCADVLALMHLVQDKVLRENGVLLEPEVLIAGEGI